MPEQDFDSLRIYSDETQPLFVEVEVEVEEIPEDALACIAEYFQSLAHAYSDKCNGPRAKDNVRPVEYLERAHFHCHKILAVHYFEAADQMISMFAGDDFKNVDDAQFISRRAELRNHALALMGNFSNEESALYKQYIRDDDAYFDNESLLERKVSKDSRLRSAVKKSYEASKEYYEYIDESIPKLNRNHFLRDRLRVLHTWQGRLSLIILFITVMMIIVKQIA